MQNLLKFVVLLFAVSICQVQAAVKVAPTLIELNANKSNGNYLTTSFSVQADKNETIRYKLYPEYFTITDEGKMNAIADSGNPDNLIPHARFVPNEFTLKNGIPQLVRVTFTDLKSLPDGESRMVMFIEDVAAKEIILPNKNKNVNTKLIVKTRLGIPIYVDNGRFVKVGSFNNLTVEKNNKNLVYRMQLSAGGNSKVRYHGKAQIIKDKKLIQEFNVNSNTIRANGIFEETGLIPNNLEEGDYILKVILTYKNEKGENKNLIKEITFNVSNSI